MADSLKFDLKAYGTNSAATEDGWVAVKPAGTTGSVTLSCAEGYFGVYETLTKYAGKPNGEVKLVWNIPEAKQFKIKNYGEFETRLRSANGTNFSNVYGATMKFVFTMDDGQTITREYLWYDEALGYKHTLSTRIDNGFQDAVAALSGDPTVVKIEFYPYSGNLNLFKVRDADIYKAAVKDDPATEDVDETYAGQPGLDHYNLFEYIQFNETAAVPTNLGTETDTWDGTAEDVHDGKITGLDSAKTYAYGPIHSAKADLITVTGVTEITGLVGGVYEVYGVEEGKSYSSKAIVVIPKVTQGSYNNYGTAKSGTFKATRSNEPVSGYYTSPTRTSMAPSGVYIASYFVKSYIAGTHTTLTAPVVVNNMESSQYYSRNIATVSYAFTPEEQVDVDKAYLHFGTFMTAAHNPWHGQYSLADKPITSKLYVYVNGDMENPAEVTYYHTSNSSIAQAIARLAEDYDGYITSIKYVQFYDIPARDTYTSISSGDGYHFIYGTKLVPLTKSTFSPYMLVDSETSFSIAGLSDTAKYNYSADGETWTEVTGVAKITGLALGTHYIQAKATNQTASGVKCFLFFLLKLGYCL